MVLYTSPILAGAGHGPGRANGALTSALRDGDSLAMLACSNDELLLGVRIEQVNSPSHTQN